MTNVHGHTHQVLYNEIGKVRSIGMLATSWPWPYAPEGVPLLTKPMIRADAGDHFDGVGWSQLTVQASGRVENEYKMWRKAVFADHAGRLRHRGQPQPGAEPAHRRSTLGERSWQTTDGMPR